MAIRLLLVLGLCCPSFSFSSGFHTPSSRFGTFPGKSSSTVVAASLGSLRGGEQPSETPTESISTDESPLQRALVSPFPMFAKLSSLGAAYGSSLQKYPIRTKSVTAGFIFALSDWLAQRLEGSQDDGKTKSTNWTRAVSSGLVGLLYFGPAAHLWYETIFKILPGSSLVSTLQKATLGQLLFGPSFTCIFFATSLIQQGSFSFKNWANKIRTDLPGAWVAGLGFWPLVDLVSYQFVPKNWIPLFVNTCSLIWTIYLSIVANRQSSTGHKD